MLYLRIKKAIIIIFLPLIISSCTTVLKVKKNDQMNIETQIWYEEPASSPQAVVVLLHGLNLLPERMNDWAHMLSAHDALVIRFALHGHTGDVSQMRNLPAGIWSEQFKEVAEIAQEKARKLQVPLYFVGFSLGALVALVWMSSHEEPTFDKMVLIAPALSVPWYSRAAVKALSVFGKDLVLPSRSPKQYRANRGTSIAAYFSLFDLKDALEKNRYKNTNIKTLVLIDRHDELVDSKEIQKLITQFRLSAWELSIVDNRFAHDNFGFRHLMVDEEAMGKKLWSSLSGAVLDHFHLAKEE